MLQEQHGFDTAAHLMCSQWFASGSTWAKFDILDCVVVLQ